jgi:hypothetical protein
MGEKGGQTSYAGHLMTTLSQSERGVHCIDPAWPACFLARLRSNEA